MSTQGTKYAVMAATLASIGAAFKRKADVYGTFNTQDADFRDLQQQINAAIVYPEDPDPAAPPPPPPAPPDLSAPVADLRAQLDAVRTTLGDFAGKFDGIEDALGVIVHALPAPASPEAPAASAE
ncbi:hypothetical protein [Pseudoduganella armeniaca]|uniref:Uncharacterized protein n=1 Tax=Pseudoduganella armeniaca TaxID=2072590 RepID=A0A2R4CBC4_9BURK|nr:hypothetical protein [Pseudoduganella armeniaca]AVR96901.1 hypothetical protein C9I28_15425 [Pseudoduganella armeniaca]